MTSGVARSRKWLSVSWLTPKRPAHRAPALLQNLVCETRLRRERRRPTRPQTQPTFRLQVCTTRHLVELPNLFLTKLSALSGPSTRQNQHRNHVSRIRLVLPPSHLRQGRPRLVRFDPMLYLWRNRKRREGDVEDVFDGIHMGWDDT